MRYDGRANFEAYKGRATHTWGDRLDLSEIPDHFLPFFQTDARVKVELYGEEVTGRVSITTGWRPALLLIRRSSSLGSSDLLRADTRLIAVQHGRTYVPVANLHGVKATS